MKKVLFAISGIFLSASVTMCDGMKSEREIRVYEVIDKASEVRTHRYWLVDNAIETDHLIVWKNVSTGKVFSCEVGRNSFYQYEKGKRYRFKINPEQSEQYQIQYACYD